MLQTSLYTFFLFTKYFDPGTFGLQRLFYFKCVYSIATKCVPAWWGQCLAHVSLKMQLIPLLYLLSLMKRVKQFLRFFALQTLALAATVSENGGGIEREEHKRHLLSIFRSCVRVSFVKCADGTSFLCSAI